MNKRIWIGILLALFFLLPLRIFAQSCPSTDQDPCANYANNDPKKSECYQNVSDACQSQSNTLTSQINYMNSQIQLTTIRIEATQEKISTLLDEINQLETEVQRLEGVLNTRLALLLHRIPAAYKRSVLPQFGTLLFSRNLSDFIARAQYLQAVQKEDAALVFQVKATQNSYNESKQVREDKKKQLDQIQQQLEVQNQQLAQQKQAKNTLLAETQGQEAIYQQLLAAAKAQLAGFSSFASNQGGASILSNQTVCDDWGCYYNQRDSQWGTVSLNNTQYSIASDGCLVTSMAMVYTHLGHKNVTPLSINANPSNFASYYPAFLNRTIVADGTTTTRIASEIDSELNASRPVVVGIRYSNGDTHFVVLISGSNGNYTMNDPFVPDGHKISFTDHYPINSIYEIDRISM
jgi:peptidoglycan hydrolase CwlO-like protein